MTNSKMSRGFCWAEGHGYFERTSHATSCPKCTKPPSLPRGSKKKSKEREKKHVQVDEDSNSEMPVLPTDFLELP